MYHKSSIISFRERILAMYVLNEKITTMEQAAKGVLYLQDDDMKEQYEQMFCVKPSSLRDGKKNRV